MKELSIEEKAKRYDDLLVKLQKAKVDNNVCDDRYCCVIDDIVPELKESEDESKDEKIRKTIYGWICSEPPSFFDNGFSKEEMFVWLEKQRDKDKLIQELGKYKVKYTQEVLDGNLNISNKDSERLRKTTIDFLKEFADKGYENAVECIDWLEKQGKHANFLSKIQVGDKVTRNEDGELVNLSQLNRDAKPDDKVKPKFHEGEWITNGDYTWKIIEVKPLDYILQSQDGNIVDDTIAHVDEQFHSFTIEDAKDGDLIYVSTEEKGIQAIFHGYKNDTIFFHCYLCTDFVQGDYMPIGSVERVYPLQKTHYNRFFEKMHEAGYEWDADKKELRKIESFDKYEGLTDFERTLADICIGWIGEEIGWKQYIKDNADILLKIAIKKFNSIQDAPFEQKPAEFDDTNAKRMFIKALEMVEELNNKGYKLTDYDKNSWWEDFKTYTSCTGEQKPTWSEEDEKMLNVAIKSCEKCGNEYAYYWLKSLKDRVQPQTTWKPSAELNNSIYNLNNFEL